jgi:hypothetical protein
VSYPKDLDDWQDEIGAWAAQTFPTSTHASRAAHMKRELKEWRKETDPKKRVIEGADILFLLLHDAHMDGTSLLRSLREKFEVNKARQWGEPDAEGVVEHVREGSA